MTVRKLGDTELGFLEEMLYEAIFIPEGQAPLPRDIIRDKSLSKYIDHWQKDRFDLALVMEVDNQLVGAIWGRLFPKENKGYGYVDDKTPEISLAVKGVYRNQGIGTRLIEEITFEYQKIGVDCLSLSVDKANEAANLYKRLGFKIVEEVGNAWTMQRCMK